MNKPKIILELAKNHGGDINRAKAMIEAASALSVHGVKLQAYNKDDIIKEHPNAERYMQCHLSIKELKELSLYAQDLGLDFFCSCFSPTLFPELRTFTEKIKVPSTFFNRTDYLRDCFLYYDDIHISTGFHSRESIEDNSVWLKSLAANKKLTIYSCTSLYPTVDEMLRLGRIRDLNLKGFSYHGKSIKAVIYAWIAGAEWIELHFNPEESSMVNWYSWDVKGLLDEIYAASRLFKEMPLSVNEKENLDFFKGEYKCLK